MLRAGVLLLLIVGCGGRAKENAPEGEAGAAVAEGGSSEPARGGASDGGADAGSGGTGLVSGSGGAAARAGAPNDEPEPAIGSGTRYCDNELYCFGLACYAPEHLYDRVCVSDCETSDDCAEGEVCLKSPDLRGSCYGICEQTSDCLYGFDCFDFTQQHEQLVCFPTKWAAYWLAHEL